MSQMKPENLTVAQKAWIAGFVDGEGFIGITRQFKKPNRNQSSTPLYHPWIIISNTSKEAIRLIRTWLGVGKVVELKYRDGHKRNYQLKISKFKEMEAVLEMIKEYLVLKNEQAQILGDFLKIRKDAKVTTGKGSRGQTSFGEEEERIYLKLKQLNKRGNKKQCQKRK